MATVHKSIEIMGESTESWEHAVKTVVTEAHKTINGIKSVWVKDMTADVNDAGDLHAFRVNCKITFEIK